MKKIPFLLTILLVAASFAASDPCKEKTNEAKKMLAKCKSIGKGNSGYEQCASDYFEIKKQAEQACRSGGLDEQDMIKAIGQWEALAKGDACRGKRSDRCAGALQQLGHYQFMLEETRGSKDHSKSLSYFLEFIDKYPKAPKTPVVLYQAAAVLEASGEDEKAFKLRDRLVKNFPNDALVPKAWLRIAEYQFMNRKFRDAIAAYKNVAGFENLTGKEAALAMYHLAEAYYNIAEYETAAYKYYDYIVGADKGKYPNDLRAEAIDFMADSFAKMGDDGLDRAKTFLGGKSVDFKDYVYRRIRENGSPSKVSGSAKALATGKLVDKRDGETYKTVRIGDREWMAENLRFKDKRTFVTEGEYGAYYDGKYLEGVCPAGWHVPSADDFSSLVFYASQKCKDVYAKNDCDDMSMVSKILRSSKDWVASDGNGTNELAFNAYPAGAALIDEEGVFQNMSFATGFYSSTKAEDGSAVIFVLTLSDALLNKWQLGSEAFAIRCIKNESPSETSDESEQKKENMDSQAQKEGVRTIKVMSDHPGGSASNKNGYR